MSDPTDKMMARIREGLTWVPAHWDRNDMRYCLGWAFDELERLRAGGCARDQKTTQFCAEAAEFARELERVKIAFANAISERDKAARLLKDLVDDANEGLLPDILPACVFLDELERARNG